MDQNRIETFSTDEVEPDLSDYLESFPEPTRKSIAFSIDKVEIGTLGNCSTLQYQSVSKNKSRKSDVSKRSW